MANKGIGRKLLRPRYQNKRYLLTEYTTAEAVERKYRRVIRRNTVGHTVTIVLVILLLLFLWIWLHPLTLLREIGKNIGF